MAKDYTLQGRANPMQTAVGCAEARAHRAARAEHRVPVVSASSFVGRHVTATIAERAYPSRLTDEPEEIALNRTKPSPPPNFVIRSLMIF